MEQKKKLQSVIKEMKQKMEAERSKFKRDLLYGRPSLGSKYYKII